MIDDIYIVTKLYSKNTMRSGEVYNRHRVIFCSIY